MCTKRDDRNVKSRHFTEDVSNIQQNEFYAVIADGTQDMSGEEQESLCEFVKSTTGDVPARTLFDVLVWSGLHISNMRDQTYDGVSNTSSCYVGCRAKVQERQPLALFFNRESDASSLIMQHAVKSCHLIRDSLQWVNELGVLLKRSGKCKAIFMAI